MQCTSPLDSQRHPDDPSGISPFFQHRSSSPLTELTTRKNRVDGIVKFLCAERFPQELEVILLKSGSL
jgi:hypothetical protein